MVLCVWWEGGPILGGGPVLWGGEVNVFPPGQDHLPPG